MKRALINTTTIRIILVVFLLYSSFSVPSVLEAAETTSFHAALTCQEQEECDCRLTPEATGCGRAKSNNETPQNIVIRVPSCTTERNVSVHITAQDASHVVLSTDPNFVGGDWQFFDGDDTYTVTLGENDTVYHIYAVLRSASGNLSNIYTVNTELDIAGNCQEVMTPVTLETPGVPEEPTPVDQTPAEQETPAVGGSEELICVNATYQISITNPDGTIRYSGTAYDDLFVITNQERLHRFEDRGEDGDFNDVIVRVIDGDCGIFTVELVSVEAMWQHKVGISVTPIGSKESKDLVIWENSQAAVGQTKLVDVCS